MKRIIFVFIIWLMVPGGVVFGAQIQMTATVDRNTVALGQTLTLEVRVSGDMSSIPNPTIPPMPGLSIRSSGRSQSVSFVNGKVSSSITFTYVIMPQTLGKLTIQPITLRVGGVAYETKPMMIEVTKTPQAPPVPGSPAPGVRKESHPAADRSKNVFVKASLDKTTAYVGEPVTYIFRFYRRIRLVGDAQFTPPELVGFVKQDLPPQKNYYADIEGSRFMVSEIRTALFPTSPGTVTIGPAQLAVTLPLSRNPVAANDFFGSFFGVRGKKEVLKTKPVKLTVLPFPSKGKPADFGGSIGDFSIVSSCDKKEGKVGEPITWQVTVKGTGNIKSIIEPVGGALSGFKKYDTVSSLNSKVKDYRITGSKVFQTVIVPEVSGNRMVPKAVFTYFDPKTKKYKVISSKKIPIVILPGETKKLSAVSAPQGSGIKMLGRDIRFIKIAGMSASRNDAPYPLRQGYWIGGLLLLLCVCGSWWYESHRMRLTHDVGWARSRAAERSARAKLKNASRQLKEGNDKIFYSEIADALNGYLADKLNISAAGLTIREAVGYLAGRGLDQGLIDRVRHILEQCDFGRFTASPLEPDEKMHLLDEARTIAKQLTEVFKK